MSGIKVSNAGGVRNAANSILGYKNPSSANTLTIGPAGIDASAATQTFYGGSKIPLGADQTWNVANANTNGSPIGFNNNEDVVFHAQVNGAPFNLGGKTLATTGAGQITIASGYTMSNGTLAFGNNLFVIQSGSNRLSTNSADLNMVVNSGTLRVQSNSGSSGASMSSAAPATVNNGGILEFRTNNDGFSLTQSGNINLNAGSTLGFITDTAGAGTYSGAIVINGASTIRSTGGGNQANGSQISGNLSGSGLANTGANDYTGGTVINGGTLSPGDGVTAGGGSIAGSIVNEGTLVLNRPDDHVLTNIITGNGTLEKAANNTVTLGTTNLTSHLTLTAGKLLLNNGGTLYGTISGPGQLQAGGGALSIGGSEPNTNTGLVTVSAGTLRLEKSSGNAVGGDITIQGAGILAIIGNDQIPDTATLNVLGSSADSLTGSTGNDTFANANVNGTSADTQMVMRNSLTITGTATVTQGIFGIGSGFTANVNAVVMNSPTAFMRIAGNTANSTMNIEAGGITASAGEVQVKYNGNNFDSILNLAGGVTTTGNFSFTNGGYAGASINAINLTAGAHTFDIGAATTTTVAPDIGDVGSLVKLGTGTLTLNASCFAGHVGGTSVNQGTLLVNGTLQEATTVAAAGTIGGTGTLGGITTVNGTVAPGTVTGKLTSTAAITLAAGSSFAVDVANWTGTTPGTDWDLLAANTLTLTLTLAATSGNKLTIRMAGNPTGFTETAKTLTIATATNPLAGFDAAAIQIDATAFSGAGTWKVQKTGDTLELVYAPSAASPYSAWASAKGLTVVNNAPGMDPDQDGAANFLEFALNGNPLSATASGKVSGKVAAVDGVQALTLTIPVRSIAAFGGTTERFLTVDGVTYRVQGSDALSNWDLIVTEVTGTDATTIQSTLPQLDSGWFYRTFRSPGPIAGDPADFLRVKVESTN